MSEHQMIVHKSLETWIRERRGLRAEGLSIGFVPTMGALHEGHLSLLRKARRENDIVLLSIFVNPTQFDNPDDLKKYPVMMEKDLELAQDVGVDHVITPDKDSMYPDDYRYRVSESELSKMLCGAHRPGHFDGVLSVVLKLFNIAGATRAYFGEKDFQQLQLIRGMAEAFFLDLEVIGCETLREADGLAMSSRNLRLTPQERELAPSFAQTLASTFSSGEDVGKARAELERLGFKVDYVEDHFGRRFGAVFLGSVRLIDNVTKNGVSR